VICENKYLCGSMNIKIDEIQENNMKSFYANKILRRLPAWFGNEKALCDYVNRVAELPFWAAVDQDGQQLNNVCLLKIIVK
jgi:hypothetical protein